ncbi:MAG TPA: hypothetical protein VKR30_00350 [Candidatus Limnocylindrales bacterium]|nr:hypothetical protein [Candidatus Limnocylindrales bacterium]
MTLGNGRHLPLAGILALAGVVVLALGGCASAGAPGGSPSPIAPSPSPASTDGTTSTGNTGSGVTPPGSGELPSDPILGQAALLTPQPGQQDLHAVNVARARATVDGTHVTVELRWWSGVAPCTVLDSVTVTRTGSGFAITPYEGSSGQPVACIDIAQLKATIVDLGSLDPGTYTIKANGDAPAITVTVG